MSKYVPPGKTTRPAPSMAAPHARHVPVYAPAPAAALRPGDPVTGPVWFQVVTVPAPPGRALSDLTVAEVRARCAASTRLRSRYGRK